MNDHNQPSQEETAKALAIGSEAGVPGSPSRSGSGGDESGTTAAERSESPVNNLRKHGGHVRFGANAPAAADGGRRPARIQIGDDGPMVTVRGNRSASGGVNRANHPGPLHLSSRINQDDANANNEQAAAAAPLTAPAHEEAGQRAEDPSVPHLSLTGARGLDEEGLDNRAFLELQRELQRHEAHDETGSDAASWNGGKSTGLERVMQTSAHQRAQQRRQRRSYAGADTPDWATSGTSTPGGNTSDSGSYDAAADSDLDHIDFMAGEIDGMPSKPKKKGTQDFSAGGGSGWSKLRGLVGKVKSPDVDPEAVREKPPPEQGGPTNTKSVPVTTSSGLRQGPRQRPDRFEREAAKLIRAHRLMRGQGGGDQHMDDMAGLGRMPSKSRRHLDSEASTPDPMDTAANLDARPVSSGGILGNLMKLYEQQQREERERTAASSGVSTTDGVSALSTPEREGGNRLDEMVAEGLRRENAKATAAGAAPVAPPSGAAGADSRSAYERRKSWNPSLATETARNGGTKIANATGTAAVKSLRFVANETGFEDVGDERPKASRSSAGVIGGLIATTGNLIGAVSPHHAQLGPNPKRPGYTLDRYLLPEMNAKTLKRTREAVASAAPRPSRRSQSQPGTPGPRSPGAESVMTRPDQNASSETQAVTPSEKVGTQHKPFPSLAHSRKQSGNILNIPGQGFHALKTWTTGASALNTPDPSRGGGQNDYFGGSAEDDEAVAKAEWQRKLKKRNKDKRKKEEIFITMHVAAILQRQEFLLKLSRALMMFGAPTHRLETQIQQTARVLEINCRCIYLPNLMLFAFGDDATHTSETKFIKQAGGLDFTKLTDMHTIYWNVIHDKIGVGEASAQLDELMRRKPLIGRWPMVIIGGFCSAFIAPGPMGFNGSFIDAVMAFPLGAFLVWSQSVITTELFSNVFEIVFASLNSFIASAVASTGIFCYAGVVSGAIVLILPGFIVLSGSLELQSKNLVAGSVRLVYAIIYSLFLGFGISIGSSFWALFAGADNSRSVPTCDSIHDETIWYRSNVPLIYALLTVPMYSTCLSLRNQAKVNRKEFPAMVLIACAGWATNHFASTAAALSGRQDITSALGSLAVGLLSNLYGRVFDGRSYVVAVTGVLYQLPSGLSNGGLLNFASTSTNGQDNFSSGFTVAQSLVEVALGLTVGLFTSTIIAYALGGRKQRLGGLFSF
ncbi:unnamed protein product [Jaminaea pallidilutea]